MPLPVNPLQAPANQPASIPDKPGHPHPPPSSLADHTALATFLPPPEGPLPGTGMKADKCA